MSYFLGVLIIKKYTGVFQSRAYPNFIGFRDTPFSNKPSVVNPMP